MPIQNRFLDFSEQLVRGTQNFPTDVLKVVLTNTLPVNTNTVLSQIVQLPATGGNLAGGLATTPVVSRAAGVTTVTGTQVVFTAAGGTIGPFRYYVLYNDTTASPLKPLISWVDHGSAVTLADTETFTVKFNNTNPGTIFTAQVV